MFANLKSLSFLLAPFFLLLGILLRVLVYFQNRSLIIDEANLARNVVEKSGTDFFQSLDYEQYCPPIFMLLTKLNTHLFGVNEFSLKLWPLLGGIGLLVFFWLLLKELVKESVVHWYLLLSLSFSSLAIRYSTEFKQYSLDALLTLVLIYVALQFRGTKWTVKNTLIWSFLGSLMIWMSMPSIFILAAIGFAFLYESWATERTFPVGLVFAGGFWLLNFGGYFWTVLYQDSTSGLLQDYHQNFFFEFIPTTIADASRSFNLLLGLMTSITDRTAVGLIFCALFLSIGSYRIIKKKKFEALLLLLPVLFVLIASNLKLYSLIPRLSLFLIPICLLLMGVGLNFAWGKMHKILKLATVVLMIISVVNKGGYTYFVTKMEFEDSKAILTFLAKNRVSKDLIIVHHDAVPAFIFYNSMHDNAYHFQPVYLAKWAEKPSTILTTKKWNSKAFWLFYAHTSRTEITAHIESVQEVATPVQHYESEAASTYGFDKK
jgi:hypothetical protein